MYMIFTAGIWDFFYTLYMITQRLKTRAKKKHQQKSTNFWIFLKKSQTKNTNFEIKKKTPK